MSIHNAHGPLFEIGFQQSYSTPTGKVGKQKGLILSWHVFTKQSVFVDHEGESVWMALRGSWLLLAVLIALSLLNGGMKIGLSNHVVQIPVVLRMLDAELYSATSFGDNLSRYRSSYWEAVAFGAKHFGLKNSLIIAHIVTRTVLLSGIFVFAFGLFAKRCVALVAVLMTMFDLRTVLVTATSIADPIPTHTVFAIALTVWALVFLWQGSLIACAVVTGIICQVNLMNGTLLVVVFAVAILFDLQRSMSWRLPAAVAVWCAISATAILWAARTPGPDVQMHVYIEALKKYFWYHLFPLTWKYTEWIKLSGLLGVLVVCLLSREQLKRKLLSRRIISGTLVGILLTWCIGVFVSIVPAFGRLVLFQWFRTSLVLVLILVPSVAYFAVESIVRMRPGRAILLSVIVCFGWALAHGLLPALLVATVCAVSLTRNCRRLADKARVYSLLYGTFMVAAIITIAMAVKILAGNVHRNALRISTPPEAWIDVQMWAKKSTPKDTVFLMPTIMKGFRVFSERDVYFSNRNLGAIMLSPHHTSEVLRKKGQMRALGLVGAGIHSGKTRISWPMLSRFCRANGLRYVVLPASVKMPRAPVYKNISWSVYAVSN